MGERGGQARAAVGGEALEQGEGLLLRELADACLWGEDCREAVLVRWLIEGTKKRTTWSCSHPEGVVDVEEGRQRGDAPVGMGLRQPREHLELIHALDMSAKL